VERAFCFHTIDVIVADERRHASKHLGDVKIDNKRDFSSGIARGPDGKHAGGMAKGGNGHAPFCIASLV
jgi:hypothetical protein